MPGRISPRIPSSFPQPLSSIRISEFGRNRSRGGRPSAWVVTKRCEVSPPVVARVACFRGPGRPPGRESMAPPSLRPTCASGRAAEPTPLLDRQRVPCFRGLPGQAASPGRRAGPRKHAARQPAHGPQPGATARFPRTRFLSRPGPALTIALALDSAAGRNSFLSPHVHRANGRAAAGAGRPPPAVLHPGRDHPR